ncbi:helix-turn-helix domain-containing protein [Rummeliibacillus sp. SL167]|uniref:helix-turn-helix domain-containing protein n=1 Tax=Rummeliibacillus sp. SL167 TaxID=2579792 RepID=UPI0011B77B98|nr:helix-turn-helix domain-containing protein [Rummeliibacillus sp. SL167]
MIENISKNLKEIRVKRGYTQAQLAKDICTQAMISNFEKGESVPSSTVLFQLAKKLNLDINYFFYGEQEQSKYTKYINNNAKTKELIRKLVRKKDYESIYYIIKNEKDRNNFSSFEDEQFLLWHEAISEYYLFNTGNKSIQKLENIVKNIKNKEIYTIQDISIMNSIAIMYFEIKEYDLSLKKYKECIFAYEKLNSPDALLEIRILYGFSRTLSALEKIEEAILNCKKAIRLCVAQESLYLLGELYFQLGRNSSILKKLDESKEFFNKAEVIFEIQGKDEFLDIIRLLKYEIGLD